VFETIAHLSHLARVGFVLMREGAFLAVPEARAPIAARPLLRLLKLFARRDAAGGGGMGLVAALTRLGPTYVKLGQFLATRPDIVGVRLARDLEALQDRMAPFPEADARLRISASLGKPIEVLFSRFGPAVAAASIAQVHQASILEDGEERVVAVKLLRPGIELTFERDMAAQLFIARLTERFVPAARRLKPVEVLETLERTVRLEMDLRFEAAALAEMAENTRKDPEFSVPGIDWDRTARDCLTMDWVDGIRLNDPEALDAAGIDRARLARITVQSFLNHALRDGFFHADMHPGNLFATREGGLVAVDCGIMGRLGTRERRFLAEILLGFITRDYVRIARVHFEAGYVPAHHSVEAFAQALRAVGEKIHGRRAEEISMAELLALLFEITALFDMATRPELVLLQKTMVVVEGVARGLDPHFDMWGTAEPVIRVWIERNLGPVGRIETGVMNVAALLESASRLPQLMERTDRVLALQEARLSEPRTPQSRAPRRFALMLGLSVLAITVYAALKA